MSASPSSLKPLHVIPTLDHRSGGPAVGLAGLALALHRAGAEVTVVVTTANPADTTLTDRLRAAGVVTRVGGDASARSALGEAISVCDVCHIHALWEPVQHRAATLCRRLRKPHLFRPCGMLDPWSLRQSALKKRLYIAWRLRTNLDRCSAIHFTTDVERDLVRPLGFKAPAIVEPNGIERAEFDEMPPPGTFREAHPIIGARPLVLFMGRLHYKKGLDLLIPAFARLTARDAVLAVVGPDEGGYGTVVESLIAEHALGDRVLLTGLLRGPDRLAALADADLFVLPSRQENFGVAVVEAMAAGTTVIVSDQVNLHTEVTSASAGAVVPVEIDALAAEMDRWLANDDGRRDAARRGRDLARAKYDWDRIAQRWLQRYAALTEGRAVDDDAGGA